MCSTFQSSVQSLCKVWQNDSRLQLLCNAQDSLVFTWIPLQSLVKWQLITCTVQLNEFSKILMKWQLITVSVQCKGQFSVQFIPFKSFYKMTACCTHSLMWSKIQCSIESFCKVYWNDSWFQSVCNLSLIHIWRCRRRG